MDNENKDQEGGKDMKGYWFHDETIPQEEVDIFNAAFAEAAKQDPRWEKMIWNRKPQEK
jgi:hypothetical protein